MYNYTLYIYKTLYIITHYYNFSFFEVSCDYTDTNIGNIESY